MANPGPVRDETVLDDLISEPTSALREMLESLPGDILILGAGGKMGPSLARLARRATGSERRVIAVSRFLDGRIPEALQKHGVETVAADLFDSAQLRSLPDAPNVIFMAGQKFGTTGEEARTWGINAFLPGLVAERYREARIVAFSTGNVYPLSSIQGNGPAEQDSVGPVGEYAQSALARERILAFQSDRYKTPMAILRLNYAIDLRYGVLRDIADKVWHGQTVDLSMGFVNVIWQRDANAFALQSLAHCSIPPLVLNLTGTTPLSVRWLAEEFGKRFEKAPVFLTDKAPTALLSNASTMKSLFGEPPMPIQDMISLVADWVSHGGRSLGKATKFENREGTF